MSRAPNVQELRPLPVDLPHWLASRQPALLAALLGWSNVLRRRWGRAWAAGALLIAACWGLAQVPATAAVLTEFATHDVLTGTIFASFFALSVMRRKSRVRAGTAASWLASLPVTGSVPPRAPGVVLRLLAIFSLEGLLGLASRIGPSHAAHLVAASAGGALVGVVAGAIVSRALGLGAPGSRYATVRPVRSGWAAAPSLQPLSFWPVARGRIFSRPRSLSRVALLVLLMLPLGTSGETAIVIGAASLAVFAILSWSAAVARVAFEAAPWLAPTGVDRWRFALALEWRILLRQSIGCAALVLLARMIGIRSVFRLAAPICPAILLASCVLGAVCCAVACRRTGLGAAHRRP